MSNYRRWYQVGGTYFFTVVTEQRLPLFSDSSARRLLGEVYREVAQTHPFETIAIVLLPDHLHAIWKMPRNDCDFSTRWKLIKAKFSQAWAVAGGLESKRSVSQEKRGSRGIWQRRFWDHLIQDETDLENHFDYIHYNPVKHRLVSTPRDWEWSTFRKYVCIGHYPAEWGRSEPEHIRELNLE